MFVVKFKKKTISKIFLSDTFILTQYLFFSEYRWCYLTSRQRSKLRLHTAAPAKSLAQQRTMDHWRTDWQSECTTKYTRRACFEHKMYNVLL